MFILVNFSIVHILVISGSSDGSNGPDTSNNSDGSDNSIVPGGSDDSDTPEWHLDGWTGPDPAYYQSFDSASNLTLLEGTAVAEAQLTQGKVRECSRYRLDQVNSKSFCRQVFASN